MPLFAGQPVPPPLSYAEIAQRVRYGRAPEGGIVSAVNGQFYEGGEFTPEHGKSERAPGKSGKKNKVARPTKTRNRMGELVEVPGDSIAIETLCGGRAMKNMNDRALAYLGLTQKQVNDLGDIFEMEGGAPYVRREIVPPSAFSNVAKVDDDWSIKKKWEDHEKARGDEARKKDEERLKEIVAESVAKVIEKVKDELPTWQGSLFSPLKQSVAVQRKMFDEPEPEEKKRKDLPGQGLLFQQVGAPVRYDAGRWVTIGGKPGKEGEKHVGGSPVFIQDGKITKGHPSLTGKRIDALKEDAEPTTHRKELNQGKSYERAKWGKKAKAEGIDPKHVHQLAAELLAHDKAFADEKTEILKDARRRLAEHGGGAKTLHLHQSKDELRGVDEVAEDLSTDYGRTITSDDLMAMLHEGNPEPMNEGDAYQAAFDQLQAGGRGKYVPSDEPIPFSAPGIPARYTLDELRARYAAWREADHPRDKVTGVFVERDGGGGSGGGSSSGPEAKLYDPPAPKPTQVGGTAGMRAETQVHKGKTQVEPGKDAPAAPPASAKPAGGSGGIEQAAANLGISNDPAKAKGEIEARTKDAEKKAARYAGLAKRAESLHAKAAAAGDPKGMAKYQKQIEMYGNSAKREQAKPGLLQQVLAYVTGQPVGGQGGDFSLLADTKEPPEPSQEHEESPFAGMHAQSMADRWLRWREGHPYQAGAGVERYSMFKGA